MAHRSFLPREERRFSLSGHKTAARMKRVIAATIASDLDATTKLCGTASFPGSGGATSSRLTRPELEQLERHYQAIAGRLLVSRRWFAIDQGRRARAEARSPCFSVDAANREELGRKLGLAKCYE